MSVFGKMFSSVSPNWLNLKTTVDQHLQEEQMICEEGGHTGSRSSHCKSIMTTAKRSKGL